MCATEPYNKLTFIKAAIETESWSEVARHCQEVLEEQGYRPKRRLEIAVETPEAKLPRSFPLPTPAGENLSYLEERGISSDLARYFHLRYSEGGVWNYVDDEGGKRYQDFGKRLIIPVHDLDGELATFQGRDVTGEKEPRYLFPKGLPGTGRFLLNGQNVKGVARLCMGEGAFDVMATKAAFDQHPELRDVGVVGSFGKNLSYGSMDGNDQLGRFIQLKTGGLREVTIMWDGGAKELMAALDAAKILNGIGLSVRIALLPDGCDPNEISPEAVCDSFRKAKNYSRQVDMQWRLRNPYIRASFPVSVDLTPTA